MEKQERTRLFYQNKGEKTCKRRLSNCGWTERYFASFLSSVKERDALSQSDLKSFIYKDRLNGEDITFERERQCGRVNLHNFTGCKVTKEEPPCLYKRCKAWWTKEPPTSHPITWDQAQFSFCSVIIFRWARRNENNFSSSG